MSSLRDDRQFEFQRDLWHDLWAEEPRFHRVAGCVEWPADAGAPPGKWERVPAGTMFETHDMPPPAVCKRCGRPDDVIEVPSATALLAAHQMLGRKP